MDIVDKLKDVADHKEIDILAKHLVCHEAANEITRLRQQLAKPAPEQILIDALRNIERIMLIDPPHPYKEIEVIKIIRQIRAAYDTKATPDNGVEK